VYTPVAPFGPLLFSSNVRLLLFRSGKEGDERGGHLTPEQTEQALVQAGWVIDGGSSEYLIVGYDDDRTSISAHRWVWEKDTHVFELSDARTRRVYWVHAIPTPWQAKLLLQEHGDSPKEEEKLGTTLYELGQYGYASS
jgi:hypothetical protein